MLRSRAVIQGVLRSFSTVAGDAANGAANTAKQTTKAAGSNGVWAKMRQTNKQQQQSAGGNNAQKKEGGGNNNRPNNNNGSNNNNNNPHKKKFAGNNNNNNNRPRFNNDRNRPAGQGQVQGQNKPRPFSPRPRKPVPGSGSGSPPSSEGATDRRFRRDDDKKRRRDDERDPEGQEKIPDALSPLLFDHEFFQMRAKQGVAVKTSEMDPLDTFLADAFMGSFKTSDRSYQVFMENSRANRVQLPKPRSMTQLQSAILPPLTDAPPGSDAHKTAVNAWNVISQNHYYTPKQQVYMVNGIASQLLNLQKQIDNLDSDLTSDMIFNQDFYKGRPGMEKEKREHLLKTTVVEDFGENKGTTDWDVDAVEDEDQL